PHIPGRRNPLYENYLEDSVEEATKYIGKVEQSLRQRGVKSLEKHVLHGDPAESIIDIASETTDRLVAMTTHGRSGLGRWLLGSVADRVSVHSQGPVLVIRATETA
ncbi:MAG: universal stress protein, partial [Chloroflexi bacterium]|nr:universal stress protein [Chloroflexota bacterium]